VAAVLYDAERTDRHVAVDDFPVEQLNGEQLLWIDTSDEAEVDRFARTLGLTGETVRALREPAAEPALFVHDGYVHVVAVTPGADGQAHALDCVVGQNWVLTVHRAPVDFLGRFDDRIRGDSELGKLDGHGFLAAILHEHVASYLTELRPIEVELDRLDLRSMTGRMDEARLLRELVAIRLRVAKLRRLLEPHRSLFALLGRSEFAVLSGSTSAADFDALSDLLERTLHSLEATREMVIGSFEIYTTWTAHGTNRVMKRLTVASVSLLPPTLLAGVMGMNSLPHALASTGAFWASTGVMAGLGVTTLGVARLRDWI
jgi:magnesium transporter